MNITALFINTVFGKELRINCNKLKITTVKDGEICILPNFNNSIFEIKDTYANVMTSELIRKIKIIGSGIIKFENNVFTYFGDFEEIQSVN